MLTGSCMVKGCTNVAICVVTITQDEFVDMCAHHEHQWAIDKELRYDDLAATYDSYDEILGK